jgi:nucleoside-triphosphatase
MSHVDIQSPFHVGRYGVDIEGFERFFVSLPFMAASHVVIDEIGKMECLSEQFRRLVTAILDRDVTCIATIALRGTGFIESIKQRPDVTLSQLTVAETALQRFSCKRFNDGRADGQGSTCAELVSMGRN